MDRHVIHALFCLLDDGVLHDFPVQVFHLAFDLFQSLIDRHRTDRHWRVPDNPLTGFMDVLACG